MRDCGNAILLVVVRRQPMIFLTDEVVEERPGPARDLAQEKRLFAAQDGPSARERATDPPCQAGRGQPQEQNRSGDQQHRRCRERQMDRCRTGNRRSDPHRSERGGEIAAGTRPRYLQRVARRIPFEQSLLRHQQPPSRAHDGVQTEERLVRKTGKLEAHLQELPGSRAGNGREMLAQQDLAGLAEQFERQPAQRRYQQDADQRQGPQPGRREKRPAQQKEQRQRRRDQTAAQIVDQLPLRQLRERIPLPTAASPLVRRGALSSRVASTGNGNSPPQPPGQLPIAANPAVAAADVGAVAKRIVFVQMHVAQQTCTRVTTFEKIMTEDAILGKAIPERLLEGVDLVDSLADERALTEHVLVNVRYGTGVGVNARLATVQSRVARAVRTRQADHHARLQDAVAGGDALLHFVVVGAIQRVRHRADKLPRRIPW
ncbi:MAG: hypothetical protein AW07_03756 [Candidatus Accumulibacter sp. SK-11]|nr:MAG: hypothetical protein AW07_03756 [Candidatus Accumulibacter sp. SK-11]